MQNNQGADMQEIQISNTSNQSISNKFSRRVGSVTMGIAMIGYGTFFAIALLFNLDLDIFLYSFKFAPFILVLLGIEILIYNVISNGEKLKFDFVSVICCSVLIAGCSVVTVIASAVQYLPVNFYY